MLCPVCDGKTLVMGGNGTYVEKRAVNRCRKCKDCGLKFPTKEKIDYAALPREILEKIHEKTEVSRVKI